jgi:hypothetical protein
MPTFTNNLLSLGKLCDADCHVLLNKHALHVYNNAGTLVLRGDREPTGARLWRVNLQQTNPPQPHPLLSKPTYAAAMVQLDPCVLTPRHIRPTQPTLIEDYNDEGGYAPTPAPPATRTPTTAPAVQATPLSTTTKTPTLPKPATATTLAPTPTPTSTPIPTSTKLSETAKRTYDLPSTPALIQYLHATAGSPVKATWLAAIKRGYFHSWPGLTYETAARYCPTPDATIKGHMAQHRQHVRSTKTTPATMQPIRPPPAHSTHTVGLLEIPLNKLFTDDTGRFPIRARSGNQYLMVAYHYTTNAILIRPFASKADAHRIPAYTAIMQRFKTKGQSVDIHILDNEASAAYRAAITANGCTYQLVPPHVHRRNAAERAIRTFKDHFLAILAGVDPTFPASRWDLLLPQAELTLNLLRPCRSDPTVSAWEGLNGYFKFDATPMGPPGSRVLLHAKPELRKSWDFRSQDGFYVGPALQHYRCYTILKKESHAVVISDTVRFRHHTLTVPNLTAEDKIIHALRALTTAIAHNAPSETGAQLQAIAALRDIFRNYANTSPAPELTQPRVDTPPPLTTQAAPPRVVATGQPEDQPWSIVPTHGPRRAQTPRSQAPIATRTRARLAASHNTFAVLADVDAEDAAPQLAYTADVDAEDAAPQLAYTAVTALADKALSPTSPMAMPVLDAETGQSLEHRQLRRHPAYKQIWDTSYADELGRLCQGIGTNATTPTKPRVEGTDTFRPIQFANIPANRRHEVTYIRVVCEVRPQKADPNRTRITIGGNHICYPGDTGTKTGSIELVKTLLNSVVSRPGARFACFDLKNFYLGTPLDRPEYVRIKLADIPQEFIDEYNLAAYAHNGWIYFEITKGVYGLKQAGKLANELLTT